MSDETTQMALDETYREAPLPAAPVTTFLKIVGAAYVGLLVFVVGYGLWGDTITAGVDVACAEAAYQDGKKLEAAGNYELAIQRYKQALQGEFTQKEREYQCRRSIGEVLFQLGRYQETIDAYRSIPPEALSAPGHYTALVSALWHAGQLHEAEQMGKTWLAKAQGQNDARQQVWAYSTLGHIYEDTNRLDEAFNFYQAATAIDPANQSGIRAAQILSRQGKTPEAIQQLDQFLQTVKSGQLYEDARKIRAQLQSN